MNLQQRLQTELIGENDITEVGDPLKHPSTASQQAFGRDKLRVTQRQTLPELVAIIASDLKGMLPEKITAHDLALPGTPVEPSAEWAQVCNGKDFYNKMIDELSAAIDRYCGLTKEEK